MSIPYIRMSGMPYSTRHTVDFSITTFTLMELARITSDMEMVRQMMSVIVHCVVMTFIVHCVVMTFIVHCVVMTFMHQCNYIIVRCTHPVNRY